MTWITGRRPPFASLEQVDSVLAVLDGAPGGMEARSIRTADEGELRVVALRQSTNGNQYLIRNCTDGAALAPPYGPGR